jgi:hypothetical protein
MDQHREFLSLEDGSRGKIILLDGEAASKAKDKRELVYRDDSRDERATC